VQEAECASTPPANAGLDSPYQVEAEVGPVIKPAL